MFVNNNKMLSTAWKRQSKHYNHTTDSPIKVKQVLLPIFVTSKHSEKNDIYRGVTLDLEIMIIKQ